MARLHITVEGIEAKVDDIGGDLVDGVSQLLAELRYLNVALFGSSAAEPAPVQPAGLLVGALFAPLAEESEPRGLAELLAGGLYTRGLDVTGAGLANLGLAYLQRLQLGEIDTTRAIQRLAEMSNRLSELYNELRTPSPGATHGQYIPEIYNRLVEIESNTEPAA